MTEIAAVRHRRATLAIHVHPDMSVEVVAPDDASLDKINETVRKRARWILRQARGFERFHPRTPERQFVAGEIRFKKNRAARRTGAARHRAAPGQLEKVSRSD